MPEIYGLDAYAPAEIAHRVEAVGVAKARLPLVQTLMLGLLAGAFIGLGALFSTIVVSDASIGYAGARIGSGLCFSLGLFLVVVAGAELFTGNNLLAMAAAAGKIRPFELARNWVLVALANFAGAAGLALIVYLSGHWEMNGGAVGQAYLKIAAHKAALDPWRAFHLGVLCNVLVCLAVWMAMAGRTVVDKFIAVLMPVSAFVAAGFEHSVANMYYFPLALLLKRAGVPLPAGADAITVGAMFGNLGPVIAGNLIGGSVLVGLVYWAIYLRPSSVDSNKNVTK